MFFRKQSAEGRVQRAKGKRIYYIFNEGLTLPSVKEF
jgi:hypothetical protein